MSRTFHSWDTKWRLRRTSRGEVPDFRGMEKYLVLIQAPDDPKLPPPSSSTAWKKKVKTGTAEEWADKIADHLSDGVPRTFNRIMIELAGVEASTAHEEVPEVGLWLAARRGDLLFTYDEPVLFIARVPGGRSIARPRGIGVYDLSKVGSKTPEGGRVGRQLLSREKSIEDAKKSAQAWTLTTGNSTSVWANGKPVAHYDWTREMAEIYTKGWVGALEQELGAKGPRTRVTDADGRTGTFHSIGPSRNPMKGYYAYVLWDGDTHLDRVRLTTIQRSGGKPSRVREREETKPATKPRKTREAPETKPVVEPRRRRQAPPSGGRILTADELVAAALRKYA